MVFLLVLVLLACAAAQPETYSVFLDGNNWQVKEGTHFLSGAIAFCEWADLRDENGWTRLKVTVNAKSGASQQQQYFGAGYLEGYVTQRLIFAAYYNYANGTGNPFSPAMWSLANSQMSWMRANVASQKTSSYWQSLGNVLSQYDGIIAGYQAAAPSEEQLTAEQLVVYALQFEIGDYAVKTNTAKSHAAFKTTQGQRKVVGEHCSVLIKVPDDGQRLLASHDTWSAYNTMLRTYKTYVFPQLTVQFSSYPGLPYSGDDWFMTSNQLVITETTNDILNASLYEYLTEQTVPYWVRVQIAATANDGETWHNLFKTYQNGGYNNQWMVIDYKLFTPGGDIQPNTLWVGEQAPGLYVVQDQSSFLKTNKYWASYNVPFYKQIWLYSGYEPYYQKYGNAYSWAMCARAQIYRRDQSSVQDLTTLKKIQRYNKWQVDPLSLQDSCRGISARCDLNAPWTNGTLNGYSAFGGIDCKATDNTLVKQMITEAVCGPTWDSQPVFWWNDQWGSTPHLELPLLYMYDFVEFQN